MTDGPITRRSVLTGLLALSAGRVEAASGTIVFAAASLKIVLDDVLAGLDVSVSYGGSGILARQIGLGAPVDLFLSANPQWMDVVMPQIIPGTRHDLLTNRLVLVGPAPASLETLPKGARIATALTDAVPLGIYAKVALQNLGFWDGLRANLIEVENAQLATTLVARGDVDFGLIYLSDAHAAGLSVLQTLPETSHPHIRYPAALLSERGRPAYDALFTPDARALYEARGFGTLF